MSAAVTAAAPTGAETPWPLADRVTEPFWEGCRQRRLLLQYCPSCDRWQFYPRVVCLGCMSSDIEWRQASGDGIVYSITIARRAVGPAFADRVPLLVALVDLAEGPRMLTNIVGALPGEIGIGDPVRARFTEVDDGVVLPTFAPAHP